MPESSRLVLGATTVALVGLATAGTGLIVSHGARTLDPSGPSAALPVPRTATPAPGPLVVARPPGTFVVPTRLDRPAPSRPPVLAAAPLPDGGPDGPGAVPAGSAPQPTARPTAVPALAVVRPSPTPSPAPAVTPTGTGRRRHPKHPHPKRSPHPPHPPHPDQDRHHDSG